MTKTTDGSPGSSDRMPIGRRLRRMRRPFMAGATFAVWMVAIAGAWHLHQRVAATGTITGYADDQPVRIAHGESGVVRVVHVRLYDAVAGGQILVSMDDRQERIQLVTVEKDIERLRGEIAAAEARWSADNARAQADVDDLERRFAVDRERARIDYLAELAVDARNRIDLRGKTIDLEITTDLADKGETAWRELNDIQTQVGSLQATVSMTVDVLDRLKEAYQEADRRWNLYRTRADVVTTYDPVLTPLRLAVDVRSRDLDEIVRRIDTHVLRAPIDGQVTAMLAHPGGYVQAGAILATISPTTTNRVTAYLPEQLALSTRVGAPVTVYRLASADRRERGFPGTIVSLSATVSEAPLRHRRIPTYPVWGRGLTVSLSDDAHLIPGEAVTLSFRGQR